MERQVSWFTPKSICTTWIRDRAICTQERCSQLFLLACSLCNSKQRFHCRIQRHSSFWRYDLLMCITSCGTTRIVFTTKHRSKSECPTFSVASVFTICSYVLKATAKNNEAAPAHLPSCRPVVWFSHPRRSYQPYFLTWKFLQWDRLQKHHGTDFGFQNVKMPLSHYLI